jgi:hypothetical protein
MLKRLITAVVYAVVVLAVTWCLTLLVGILPLPGGVGEVLVTIIWVIGVIIAVLMLLRVLLAEVPDLP